MLRATRTPGSSSGGTPHPALIAFCVAAATLLLQLVETRIYAVLFWNHVVYFIVSIALLGFGISGTWLSLGPDTRLARLLTRRNAAVAFVASTLVAVLLVPAVSWVSLSFVFRSVPQLVQLLGTYAIAVLPFFFAGWILGSLFRDHARRIHVLYFADLTGAGTGCLIFLLAMQRAGAVNLVLLACALVCIPALIFELKNRTGRLLFAVCLALLLLLGVFNKTISSHIRPEPGKAINLEYRNVDPADVEIELSEWNTISRIDVVASKTGFPCEKGIFIDGDAWTFVQVDAQFPATPYDAAHEPVLINKSPYFFKQEPESVLVIGTGGGVDVYNALRAGAKRIDAVEINPTTFRIMLEEYREASNGLMVQPGVHAWREEGRSFVRRSDTLYDVIVLFEIDTFTAINAGAYVLSENYLYTIDAIKDYVGHLKGGGLLCITRAARHPETSRMFIICLEALYEMGVEEPEKCILFHEVGWVPSTILVRPTPFSEDETRRFIEHVNANNATMYYPLSGSEDLDVDQTTIHEYVAQRAAGTQQAYLDSLPLDISPVTDDSPFFFHYDRPRNLLNVLHETDVLRGHWPSFTLFVLLAFTAVMVVVFMLLPLASRRRPDLPRFPLWLLFFGCLGVSFIFVEIALMQRFALLLGHPSRSLALVLAALLVSAGAGSYLRARLNLNLNVCLSLLILAILGAAFVYPRVVQYVLGWTLMQRGFITLALVAPLGFFMGMPFPTGIGRVSEHAKGAVPWMWAVNGGTTVFGSVLAIVLAIWGSFTLVLSMAALGYVLALLVSMRLLGDGAGHSGESRS